MRPLLPPIARLAPFAPQPPPAIRRRPGRFWRGQDAFTGGEKALLICAALAIVILVGHLISGGGQKAAGDAARVLRTAGAGQGTSMGQVVGPIQATSLPESAGTSRPPGEVQQPKPTTAPAPAQQERPGFFGQIGGFFKGIFDAGKETVEGLWGLGKGAFNLTVGWITNPDEASKTWEGLKTTVSSIWDNPVLLWDAIKEPYVTAWQEGRYGEAIGRGTFEVVLVVLGTKGVDKVAKGGTVGGAVDDVARAGTKVDDLARAGTKIDDVGRFLDEIRGSIKNHPLRQAYEDDVARLADRAAALERQGQSPEEIARILHQERRDLGRKYKDVTPDLLREYIYDVNLQRYGDPLGPSFDYLVKKHTVNGVTDYRAIIEGASRPNPDVDKLLAGFEEWLRKKGKIP